jgi:hypothetical protein
MHVERACVVKETLAPNLFDDVVSATYNTLMLK